MSVPGPSIDPSAAPPLRIEDAGALRAALAGLGHRLSEYCPANLVLFRAAHDYRTVESPARCIAGRTYDGVRHLMPLFDLAAHSPARLQALLAGHDCFYPIPEQTVQRLPGGAFRVAHVDADADYLYRAADLRAYAGTRLRKKRNLMRQFERDAAPRFVPLDAARAGAARAVLDAWLAESGKAPAATDHGPCAEAIALRDTLGLQGWLAETGAGEPAGFLLASRVWPDTLAVHFAKGLRRHPGVYQYLFNRFACAAAPACEFINFEQDLGNPRFRHTKRSYAPVALLRKYRVFPN
ncbi:MAG: phosphatidylglycerol lysyltransferase domain-containing protein [Gammaproteobacteria bacterium]